MSAIAGVLGAIAFADRIVPSSPVDQEGVAAYSRFYHSSDLYRSGCALSISEIANAHDFIFMADGLNSTVGVSRAEGNGLALRINGKVDGSSRDSKTCVIMLAALPLAMHPAPPPR